MSRTSYAVFLVLFLASATTICAKGKHPKTAVVTPTDEIQVVSYLPLTGGTVTRFVETQHYRRNYLYAEHESGKTLSLIDVTSAASPVRLNEMTFPLGGYDNLVAVAGNAALVSSAAGAPQVSMQPQTFRIMSFADPLHPIVKQELEHVTAISYDEKRGLIFLANDAGLWILKQSFAVDPTQAELEREIERTIYDTP